MYKQICPIEFPRPTGVQVNMMPIIAGDMYSIPDGLRQYNQLCSLVPFAKGSTVYLTITESQVAPGDYQRRPGLHTDGTRMRCWGGGWGGGSRPVPPQAPEVPVLPAKEPPPAPSPRRGWGGGLWGGGVSNLSKGIYLASSDGCCKVYDCITYDVDDLGALSEEPQAPSKVMEPSTLYWITDRTPHASLPSCGHYTRQFFRLVADEIGVWFAQHSTPNPLGVQPNAPIEYQSKFVVPLSE